MLPSGNKALEWLASTQLSLILFGLLAVTTIPGTMMESQREYYSHPVFVMLLSAFGFHLAICTGKRWQSLSRSTLAVHAGVLVIMGGALLTGTGYVATINIYEGESSATVFRWDTQRDTPFGHDIRIRKINIEYHPTPLKIGVKKGAEKYVLKTVKTGESFALDGFTVKAERIDPVQEAAFVSVLKGGQPLGSADTRGTSSLPADFPFSFTLVAFQKAVVKRLWVDLELLQHGHVVASGITETNHPFYWNGLDFFNTEVNFDEAKRPYAGIQIIRDPGKYVVYVGMFILTGGTLAAWYRRFKR